MHSAQQAIISTPNAEKNKPQNYVTQICLETAEPVTV
jgi:hypothetical protein